MNDEIQGEPHDMCRQQSKTKPVRSCPRVGPRREGRSEFRVRVRAPGTRAARQRAAVRPARQGAKVLQAAQAAGLAKAKASTR